MKNILDICIDKTSKMFYSGLMNNTANYFNLNVLRGSKWITSYPFTGTVIMAKKEAFKIAEIHAGAVVSVENKSGLVVAVAK